MVRTSPPRTVPCGLSTVSPKTEAPRSLSLARTTAERAGPGQEELAAAVLRVGSARTQGCSPLQDLNVQAPGRCVALLKGHLGLVPYLLQPYSNAYVLDGF